MAKTPTTLDLGVHKVSHDASITIDDATRTVFSDDPAFHLIQTLKRAAEQPRETLVLVGSPHTEAAKQLVAAAGGAGDNAALPRLLAEDTVVGVPATERELLGIVGVEPPASIMDLTLGLLDATGKPTATVNSAEVMRDGVIDAELLTEALGR